MDEFIHKGLDETAKQKNVNDSILGVAFSKAEDRLHIMEDLFSGIQNVYIDDDGTIDTDELSVYEMACINTMIENGFLGQRTQGVIQKA